MGGGGGWLQQCRSENWRTRGQPEVGSENWRTRGQPEGGSEN